MTGGLKYMQWIDEEPVYSCATCGASLADKYSSARTCSDRCRKIKNGQTKNGGTLNGD